MFFICLTFHTKIPILEDEAKPYSVAKISVLRSSITEAWSCLPFKTAAVFAYNKILGDTGVTFRKPCAFKQQCKLYQNF